MYLAQFLSPFIAVTASNQLRASVQKQPQLRYKGCGDTPAAFALIKPRHTPLDGTRAE
jgi:hypothetical protein